MQREDSAIRVEKMANVMGYMVTWTTYGTWLQGDKRGYVKNGKILPPNDNLLQANKANKKGNTIKLSKQQRKIVHNAILKESEIIGQKILALTVCSNHVHLVLDYFPKPISNIVAYYKKAGRLALKETGLTGKIWAKGYDKRFCYDEMTLNRRIKYVKSHNTA
ncbi:MAG: transposase [Sedimentisphaerales bacterium]|nr:transposase [Sedimentisphaerales bacterium]